MLDARNPNLNCIPKYFSLYTNILATSTASHEIPKVLWKKITIFWRHPILQASQVSYCALASALLRWPAACHVTLTLQAHF
jgi:hypothetical protein